MKGISNKQKETLLYWYKFWKENTYYPTLEEGACKFNISYSSFVGRLVSLVNKGYLEKRDGRHILTKMSMDFCEKELENEKF